MMEILSSEMEVKKISLKLENRLVLKCRILLLFLLLLLKLYFNTVFSSRFNIQTNRGTK